MYTLRQIEISNRQTKLQNVQKLLPNKCDNKVIDNKINHANEGAKLINLAFANAPVAMAA